MYHPTQCFTSHGNNWTETSEGFSYKSRETDQLSYDGSNDEIDQGCFKISYCCEAWGLWQRSYILCRVIRCRDIARLGGQLFPPRSSHSPGLTCMAWWQDRTNNSNEINDEIYHDWNNAEDIANVRVEGSSGPTPHRFRENKPISHVV